MDPLQILKEHGINYIRLRVWVDPQHGYNNVTSAVQFAKKVKSEGMKLLIDFHYSDTWADPEHQLKPAAWANHTFIQLQKDVYNHTLNVCNRLNSNGTVPDMVQIGNEINPGMLLPDGSTNNWEKLAALLKKGYDAVKACSPSIQVMLHIANAGNWEGVREWFDHARAEGVEWDVTGLSYYSYWHGSLADMKATLAEVQQRYHKPVVIAETAYPFTLEENDNEQNVIHLPQQLTKDFPATPTGQARNLRAVLEAAQEEHALGVFYWEPTWTAVQGNGWNPDDPLSGSQWENQALFDFDGRVLPAMNEFTK